MIRHQDKKQLFELRNLPKRFKTASIFFMLSRDTFLAVHFSLHQRVRTLHPYIFSQGSKEKKATSARNALNWNLQRDFSSFPSVNIVYHFKPCYGSKTLYIYHDNKTNIKTAAIVAMKYLFFLPVTAILANEVVNPNAFRAIVEATEDAFRQAGVFPNAENTPSQRVKRQTAPDPNDIMSQVGNYRHENKASKFIESDLVVFFNTLFECFMVAGAVKCSTASATG